MALPTSGTITAAMINVELGRASTAFFNLNGSAERSLAGMPSGAIDFADFYGKSSYTAISVSVAPSYQSFSVATSTTLTATVTGGNGSHSYNWSRNNTNFNISPNGSSCNVSWGTSNAGTCIITCVVNDGQTNDSATATVYVGIIE